MNQKIKIFITFCILNFTVLLAQSEISHYTNFSHIPRAVVIPHQDFRLKFLSTTHLGDGNDNLESKRVASFDVGLFDWIDVGSRLAINQKNYSYNLKVRVFKEENHSLNLAFGVVNAFPDNKQLDYSGFSKSLDNGNSFYIVSGKTFKNFYNSYLTIGFGNGVFKSSDGISEYAFGLFGAIEKDFSRHYLTLEFDGLKFSTGVGIKWTDNIITSFQLRGIEDIFNGGSNTGIDATGFAFGVNYFGTFNSSKIKSEKEQTAVLKDEIMKDLENIKSEIENTEQSFLLTTNSLKSKQNSQLQLQDSLRLEIMEIEKQINSYKLSGRLVSVDLANRILAHLRISTKLFYQGDYNLAKEECVKAIELEPKIPISHSKLGSVLHKLGNREKAIEEWEIALELDPLNEKLAKFLKGIKK